MKLTNYQIYDLYEGLKQIQNLNLPLKESFLIVKNEKILEPLYISIVEIRNKIVNSYKLQSEEELTQEILNEINIKMDELGRIENDVILELVNIEPIQDMNVNIDIIRKIFPILKE